MHSSPSVVVRKSLMTLTTVPDSIPTNSPFPYREKRIRSPYGGIWR